MNEQRKIKVEAVVRAISEELKASGNGGVVHKLSVVLHKCGYQTRQMDFLKYLERELEHEGIYVEPLLTAARTTDKLAFHRDVVGSNASCRLLLHAEKELEELLLDNFRRTPAFANLNREQRQVQLKAGRVDILCRDKQNNDFVVIELKARQPDAGTLEQLIHYMQEVEQTKAKSANVGVRGIILSGRPNDRILKSLAAVKYKIDWYCYRVGIDVFPMPR